MGFTKKVEKGYMRLCDCFQLILLSFYTNHCSYKRTQRYLQECLFDPFVTKEMSSRDIYTKPLRVQAEIKTTRYHLPNVCSYHAKLIVRLVLLLNNDSAIVKLICHVLYMMELLIKEKLLASQDFRKKYNEGEPDSAFEIEFKARWKYLLKLKNRKTMGGPNYFNITFKFCLQILSPLLEHLRNLGETDYSNIFQSKRYVQSELLMLKDKSFIAEFQILNWDKLLNWLRRPMILHFFFFFGLLAYHLHTVLLLWNNRNTDWFGQSFIVNNITINKFNNRGLHLWKRVSRNTRCF